MADTAPAPAGFLARYVAWSLDATVVGFVAWLLTQSGFAAHATALRMTWSQLQQVAVARMAGELGQMGDPTGLATQLMQDPALRSAASAAEAALHALLLPPILAFVLLAALYWIGFERSAWQATPGKRALGLRVTDLEGHRLALARAAARHVAGAMSWLTLNLGHAMAALPPQKRTLHDLIAGTRVVCADAGARLPAWAVAWLALQVVVGVLLPAWWLLRAISALQGSLLQV